MLSGRGKANEMTRAPELSVANAPVSRVLRVARSKRLEFPESVFPAYDDLAAYAQIAKDCFECATWHPPCTHPHALLCEPARQGRVAALLTSTSLRFLPLKPSPGH